ncbi:MAG: hypothetical protein JXR69_00325 [Candidatus Delongbacteria bacterium]|nr:hypothetical protein [Candidatus Delongbacteria bacterium]
MLSKICNCRTIFNVIGILGFTLIFAYFKANIYTLIGFTQYVGFSIVFNLDRDA